jgi:RNA-binding protein YlmH
MTDEKRLLELARRAAREGKPSFSRFLEPSMIPVAEKCARQAGARVAFFGGYESAERAIAAFTAEEEEIDYPIACLELRWNKKYGDAGHRDLLGAVMGLGIDREATGDIVVADGVAYLFAEREMARYIANNLASAGRARLTVTEKEGGIEAPEPEGVRARITFSSPRLDAILSAGYDLSRAEAQRMIAAGLVKQNHMPEERTDAQVREGDLLSARGLGRLRVEEMLGETKKGRLSARVFRYGK